MDESDEDDGMEEDDYKDGSDDDDDMEGDDDNEDENTDDATVNANLANPNCDDPVKTICYEDVNLILLPNPTGTRDLLALEIDLWYTKGHQRQTKR